MYSLGKDTIVIMKTADKRLTIFQDHNIPCGPTNTLGRAFENKHWKQDLDG